MSYHKIEVRPTKPSFTNRSLYFPYTAGFTEPCRVINKKEDDGYKCTTKRNLVVLISNGTAIHILKGIYY